MKIKLKLKKIDPVKAGVVYGLLLALMGLIIVVPMFLFMSAAGLSNTGNGLAMFGGGIAMVIFVPILYGILGFIMGLIGTALMNFILSKTNGLNMEFDSDNLEISDIGKKESDLKF